MEGIMEGACVRAWLNISQTVFNLLVHLARLILTHPRTHIRLYPHLPLEVEDGRSKEDAADRTEGECFDSDDVGEHDSTDAVRLNLGGARV